MLPLLSVLARRILPSNPAGCSRSSEGETPPIPQLSLGGRWSPMSRSGQRGLAQVLLCRAARTEGAGSAVSPLWGQRLTPSQRPQPSSGADSSAAQPPPRTALDRDGRDGTGQVTWLRPCPSGARRQGLARDGRWMLSVCLATGGLRCGAAEREAPVLGRDEGSLAAAVGRATLPAPTAAPLPALAELLPASANLVAGRRCAHAPGGCRLSSGSACPSAWLTAVASCQPCRGHHCASCPVSRRRSAPGTAAPQVPRAAGPALLAAFLFRAVVQGQRPPVRRNPGSAWAFGGPVRAGA